MTIGTLKGHRKIEDKCSVISLGLVIHDAKYQFVSLKSVDRIKTVCINIYKQSNMFATGVTFKYNTKKEGFILVPWPLF